MGRAVVQAVRRDRCEYCGAPASGEPHHIRPRSLGGRDVRENLIQLCPRCHLDADDYRITPIALLRIVARREGKTLEEVYEASGWASARPQLEAAAANFCSACGRLLSREDRLAGRRTCSRCGEAVPGRTLPSLDELLQVFVSFREQEEEGRWGQAAALVVMRRGMGMKWNRIASLVGFSNGLVRAMVKTFEAFPEEALRIPTLGFTHHRIAAATAEPLKWVALAADNGWSTRQLREAILREAAATEEARQDLRMAKAEKALRLAREVFAEGGAAAEWLAERLAAEVPVAARLGAA
ncbi:MAG: HNH endonuclease [Moorellales bacterium]